MMQRSGGIDAGSARHAGIIPSRFGKSISPARRHYREFVKRGIKGVKSWSWSGAV
jgi:hypothetical protein